MKRSDIIADALGELDEKTLTVQEKPKKEKTQHLLPQLIAFSACLLAAVIALPILRTHLAKSPVTTDTTAETSAAESGYAPDTENETKTGTDTETDAETEAEPEQKVKKEWEFTTKGQPASVKNWIFTTDSVIDKEAEQYFPDLTAEGCVITGHNIAVFPAATMLSDYFKKLEDQGFKNIKTGDENVFYKDGVIIREDRCQNPISSINDSFKVRVYASVQHGAAGALTPDEALDVINKNCLKETVKRWGGGYTSYEEEFIHDDVPCAADVTPEGFYELTGMQIFVCPWSFASSVAYPEAVAFFVTGNGAVITDMGADRSYSSRLYQDIDMCLSVNGYYGGPVICDMDGDGENEMVLLTPYTLSGKNQVSLTVYKTGAPAVLAKSKNITFKAEHQQLLYAVTGEAVIHSWSDDGRTDAYFEIRIEDGEAVLYDAYGTKTDLNLKPEDQIVNGERTLCETDKFAAEEPVDENTSLTQDWMIDRSLFDGLKMFDAGGKKWIITHENDKNVKLIENVNGEYKITGGYKFRYNSLAMVYYANASDGNSVYTLAGMMSSKSIYRYDLQTGDVYTFIETEDPVTDLHYCGGVIYYTTHQNRTYTLKAAVLSEKKIYALSKMETGEVLIAYFADNGVFFLINDSVYYSDYNGKSKTVASVPDGVILSRAAVYGERLYMLDGAAKELLIIDSSGSIQKANIGVSDTSPRVKSDKGGYYYSSRGNLDIYNGAVVSCVKEDGGEYGIYLYHPEDNSWDDLMPDVSGGIRCYSFCADDPDLYVYDKVNTNNGIMVYSSGRFKSVTRADE